MRTGDGDPTKEGAFSQGGVCSGCRVSLPFYFSSSAGAQAESVRNGAPRRASNLDLGREGAKCTLSESSMG